MIHKNLPMRLLKLWTLISFLFVLLTPALVRAAETKCYAGLPVTLGAKQITVHISVSCDERFKSKLGSTQFKDQDECYLVEFNNPNYYVPYAGTTTCSAVQKLVDNETGPNSEYVKGGGSVGGLFNQYSNNVSIGPAPAPPGADDGTYSECYEGVVVEGKTIYSKVNCTAAYRAGVGIDKFEYQQCYMADNSTQPPTKGKMPCDEARGKVSAQQQNPQNPQGTIHAGQATTCPVKKNLIIPTWYEYLPVADNCAVKLDIKGNPSQVWLIGLALADMLLRLAGLITVFVIISGGYKYMTSQFDPEGTKKAKDTILNGLIGLVIVVLSTGIVNFIGNTLK